MVNIVNKMADVVTKREKNKAFSHSFQGIASNRLISSSRQIRVCQLEFQNLLEARILVCLFVFCCLFCFSTVKCQS